MPHDDFSFLTGKQADLDNDGKVSFGEYMNDCDDFNRIMGIKIIRLVNINRNSNKQKANPLVWWDGY